LRLTGYYRRLIKGYGSIATLLTAMLKKNAFIWDGVANEAFLNLKIVVTHSPVLALPNFAQPFVIECDASGVGLGAKRDFFWRGMKRDLTEFIKDCEVC
jgi:hypothetical protein